MPDWRLYVRQNLKLSHATPQDEADVVEDIARQLEDAYLEALNQGLSPEEAEEEAKLHITDWNELSRTVPPSKGYGVLHSALQKERRQHMSIVDWIDSLIRDVRYATRRLRRSLGFTVVAVLTLGLGIGGNTVIFSAINSLLLNPAGLKDGNRILAFGVIYEKLNVKSTTVSPAEFLDVRDSKEVFSAAAMGTSGNYNYTVTDFPERLLGERVTPEWFDVFGVKPMLGRLFTAEEDKPNVNRVVILDYGAWQRLFGGDASVINRTIELNQQPYKVIGIMGPEFRRRDVNLWTPLALPPTAYTPRSRFNESYDLVARIKPGVSLEQAMAHVRLLTERVHQDSDVAGRLARDNGWSITAQLYPESIAGDLKSPMFVLMGAVGFVLLIACANVAGLMLARAVGQTRELAVRGALGASRWLLIRQTLTECLLIALGGLVVAMFTADAGIRVLLALAPQNLRGISISVDATVMAFTAVIGVGAGVIFGLIPSLQTMNGQKMEFIKEGGRFGTATRRQLRLRSVLVTLEIALALVLIVGTGLFARSLSNLEGVDTGFDAKGVMTGMVALPPPLYREPDKQRAFHQSVLERLANIPGVLTAATGIPIPFVGDAGGAFAIEGMTSQPGQPAPQGRLRVISPDYFATLRIPLLRGRTFTNQDTANTEPVVIIDENLANQYWPNQDPIGKRIRRTTSTAQWTTIVGIVRHIKHNELAADSGKGVHYYPVYQTPQATTFAVLARTTLGSAKASDAIREAIRTADPGQSVFELRTLEDRVLDSVGSRRFAVQLMAIFAALGSFMAAIGLYGVISYVVAQRTHEIGIRVALGARGIQILGLIVRQGMRVTMAGIILGSIGALVMAKLLSSQLFQVRSFDPATFALTAVIVSIVALLACIIPARRATNIDPLDACRYE